MLLLLLLLLSTVLIGYTVRSSCLDDPQATNSGNSQVSCIAISPSIENRSYQPLKCAGLATMNNKQPLSLVEPPNVAHSHH